MLLVSPRFCERRRLTTRAPRGRPETVVFRGECTTAASCKLAFMTALCAIMALPWFVAAAAPQFHVAG
jgi:hypothetical protein